MKKTSSGGAVYGVSILTQPQNANMIQWIG